MILDLTNRRSSRLPYLHTRDSLKIRHIYDTKQGKSQNNKRFNKILIYFVRMLSNYDAISIPEKKVETIYIAI